MLFLKCIFKLKVDLLLLFSLRVLWLLHFTFGSMTHFEFIFRKVLGLCHIFSMYASCFSSSIFKKTILFPIKFILFFCRGSVSYVCVGLLLCSFFSVTLICYFASITVLITVAVWKVLKSDSIIPQVSSSSILFWLFQIFSF